MNDLCFPASLSSSLAQMRTFQGLRCIQKHLPQNKERAYFCTWVKFPTDRDGQVPFGVCMFLPSPTLSSWTYTHSSHYSLDQKSLHISTDVLLSCGPKNCHLGTAALAFVSWWIKASILQQPAEEPAVHCALLNPMARSTNRHCLVLLGQANCQKQTWHVLEIKPRAIGLTTISLSQRLWVWTRHSLRWQLQQLKPVLLKDSSASASAVWKPKSPDGPTHSLLDSNYPSIKYVWSCLAAEQTPFQDPFQAVHCVKIFSIMIICDVELIYRAGRVGQTEKNYFNLNENWKKVSGSNKVRGSSFLFQILSKQLPCVSSFSCRKERPLCKTQRQQNSFVRSQETSDKYGSKAKELSWQLLTDCSKPAIHPKRKGWEEGGSG